MHTRAALGLVSIVLAGFCTTGCRPEGVTSRPAGELQIVCTFLPVYVFTMNIVRDVPGVSAALLVSADAGCPHHYSLRPADLKRIADARLILANGLGLEPFLDDLARANPRAKIVTVSGDCDALPTTQPAHGEHCEHEHHDRCDHGQDVNPHVWVSPRQAIRQVQAIARALVEVDPSHADAYTRNSEAYVARLQTLDAEMQRVATRLSRRHIVTLHDAFAYLARDMGLNVVATLQLEPGQEPSARRMAEIIGLVRETKAVVFYEPGTSDRVARTVARDAGAGLFPLNPLNTVPGEPAPDSYEKVMRENLRILSEAMGGSS